MSESPFSTFLPNFGVLVYLLKAWLVDFGFLQQTCSVNVISDLGSLEVFGDLGFAQNCVWWTGFCSGQCFVIAVGVFDKLSHWFYFRQKLIIELVWVLCKLHEILKISIVAHIRAHLLDCG